MIPVDQVIVQIVNGLVNGMILALVASGLTLIFGIMDIVNFAHGDLFMLGAYIGTTAFLTTGNFWVALVASVLAMAVIGAGLQVTALRPLVGRDPLTTILATFGLSLVIQNYALWQYGPVPRKIVEPITGHFRLFYVEYPWYRLLIAVLSAAIIGGLYLFMKYGKHGIWIRATTQDRVMAAAMGIPVPWVHTVVFAIGAGMAAASGSRRPRATRYNDRTILGRRRRAGARHPRPGRRAERRLLDRLRHRPGRAGRQPDRPPGVLAALRDRDPDLGLAGHVVGSAD